MNFRVSLIGFALANAVLPLAWAARPGEPAPNLALRDSSGTPVRLSDYRHKKHVAVLAQPSKAKLNAAANDDIRRLAMLESVALFLASDTEAGRNFLDQAPSATILIDDQGTVRRVLTGRVLTGPELVDFVEIWHSGRAVYNVVCSRCHGAEGDSTLCEGVKPLVGIGRRLTEAQIRERMRPGELSDKEVLIREQILSREEFRSVVAYIAGL